jgi:hypothetical protein
MSGALSTRQRMKFSTRIRTYNPVKRYFGANPNVRSKRLA